MSYTNLQERRLGRDLVLPKPGDTVQPTSSGDWPTIAGRENLKAAVERHAVTSPGELLHRPEYGAGLLDFLEQGNEPGVRAQMAVQVRQSILRDPRLQDAQVAVETGTTIDQVVVTLQVQPKGEEETDTVVIAAG